MATTQDLLATINRFKLETQHCPGYTLHTSYSKTKSREIQPGLMIGKRWYRRKESIGHGFFGAVWLEEAKNNLEVTPVRAVKDMSKQRLRHYGLDFEREILAFAKLAEHPASFVEFYGWFENDVNVSLAMEYFPLGDLNQHIKQNPLAENDTWDITAQLLDALVIMHAQHFTHRDIKPANIFVTRKSPRWWVKLGDFGMTKRVAGESSVLHTEVGTRAFRAPEIMDPDVDSYTNAVDMLRALDVSHSLTAEME